MEHLRSGWNIFEVFTPDASSMKLMLQTSSASAWRSASPLSITDADDEPDDLGLRVHLVVVVDLDSAVCLAASWSATTPLNCCRLGLHTSITLLAAGPQPSSRASPGGAAVGDHRRGINFTPASSGRAGRAPGGQPRRSRGCATPLADHLPVLLCFHRDDHHGGRRAPVRLVPLLIANQCMIIAGISASAYEGMDKWLMYMVACGFGVIVLAVHHLPHSRSARQPAESRGAPYTAPTHRNPPNPPPSPPTPPCGSAWCTDQTPPLTLRNRLQAGGPSVLPLAPRPHRSDDDANDNLANGAAANHPFAARHEAAKKLITTTRPCCATSRSRQPRLAAQARTASGQRPTRRSKSRAACSATSGPAAASGAAGVAGEACIWKPPPSSSRPPADVDRGGGLDDYNRKPDMSPAAGCTGIRGAVRGRQGEGQPRVLHWRRARPARVVRRGQQRGQRRAAKRHSPRTKRPGSITKPPWCATSRARRPHRPVEARTAGPEGHG